MGKKRLGEMLLEAGVIDEHKLQAALGHQRKWGGRLGQAFVDLKLTTEAQIVTALSRKFGYQVVPPHALEAGPMLESALKVVPREFASRHNLIPFAIDSSTISVAMSDPANIAVVDEIRFRTGRRVQIALAGDQQIGDAVRRHYFNEQGAQPVEAIPFDPDTSAVQGETVVEQFGGGSTDALDDFFSRPPEPVPVAPPGAPAPLFPTALASAPRASEIGPAAAVDQGVSLPAIDLDDILAETPAARVDTVRPSAREPSKEVGKPGKPAPREDHSFDLHLEETEPVLATDLVGSGDPMGQRASRPPASRPAGGPGARGDDQAVLDVLDRLVHGEPVAPEVVKPAQMVAALVRLLLQKRVISEEEFLAEFRRK